MLVISKGKQIATLKSDAKGRVVIQFDVGAIAVARHAALAEIIGEFLSE